MQTTKLRVITLLSLVLLLAPAGMPLVSAQGTLSGAGSAAATVAAQARSVGTFDVVPVAGAAGQGFATGSVVSSLIAEAGAGASGTGILKDFAVAGADASGSAAATVFSSIDIKGFTPVAKLQGVGTSSLVLRGEGVVVTLTDSVNSLLVIRATGQADQQVAFTTPPGVTVEQSAAASNVWEVKGAVEGALVLVDARGQAAAAGNAGSNVVVEGQNRVSATLKQHGQLVFRADSAYRSGASAQGSAAADAAVEAYNEAVVEAIAKAMLAGEATTEFSSGVDLIANANHFSDVSAKTDSSVEKRVTTQLRSSAEAAASASSSASAQGQAKGRVLAYDVDYVDLPARSADNVAVYVNGALAQRVDAASHVNQNAAAGVASYWATTVEGRVLVLASTDAKAAATVTLAAVADAATAATTLARLDAQLGVVSQVQGGFSLLGNLESSASGAGEVIGTFNSFFASEAQGRAEVQHYADVRSSAEVFAAIHFAADAAADASAQVASRAQAAGSAAQGVQMDTSVAGRLVATATFTDSVYSAIVAQAHAATTARFDLGKDVDARILAGTDDKVAVLSNAQGKLGYLVLANADGAGQASGRLDASAAGEVQARLQQGEAIVFRSATEAQAKVGAEAAAKAIAAGSLASEVAVGLVANAVSSAKVDYQSDVDTRVVTDAAATHRGQVTYEVIAHGQAQATAVAMTADRATLAANSAQDVLVKVNGQAAARAHSAAEVHAAASAAASAGAQAKYFVSTNLLGQTQVLTSIPNLAVGKATQVVVESQLDAQARLNAALDVFGSFQPGYGGAATGSIVSLVAKQDAGLILDYTVASKASADAAAATTKVFDAVKLGGSAFASASASSASAIRFQNEQGAIEAYDVSAAVMKLSAAADTSAVFDLAANVDARVLTENVVMLSSPDFSGALILIEGQGSAAADAQASAEAAAEAAARSNLDASAAAKGQVVANMAAGTQVVFKAFSGFEAELGQAQKEAHAKAIAEGRLLGQVIVDTAAGASAATTTTASVNYYAHVQAITSVATADKVEILVDSAASAGKSIVISLDRETVRGLIHGDAKLLVDGKAVARAASYEDALVPDADKYWLITTEGEAGLQAIVTLAHFSTRTITLETPQPPSIFLWTTVGLGVVVVGQAAWPHMRRKWA